MLRPYQLRALDEGRQHFRSGVHAVLFVAPTGAGKTCLFCEMVKNHVAKGGRVLIVVHRRELLFQAKARLEREGVTDVGLILSGADRNPEARVQIASIQTLLALDTLPEATLVVFDEAHHFVAEQWGRIGKHYAHARIVGVTATPERADGSALGDLFDKMVLVDSVAGLTEKSFLVPCDVVAPAKSRKSKALEPIEAWKEHAEGRKTVVFAESVAEARKLAAEFNAAGVAAAHVDGTTHLEDREARIEAFGRGDLTVLTNCYVLTEGFDCPSVEVVMLARGCSSVGAYLQMVGRALRPSPETGKTSALLIDLRGVVHKHGLPDEDRTFSLEGRPIGRGPTKECCECETDIPLAAQVCAFCGAEQPVGTGDGGNHTEEPKEALRRISKRDVERAYFMEQLEQARARGFRPGYVVHRFKERFGRAPWALWREFFPKSEAA